MDRSRDPATRKEHVEGVERRLRQEEAKNQALSKKLARLRLLETSRARQASHTPRDGGQVRYQIYEIHSLSRDNSSKTLLTICLAGFKWPTVIARRLNQ